TAGRCSTLGQDAQFPGVRVAEPHEQFRFRCGAADRPVRLLATLVVEVYEDRSLAVTCILAFNAPSWDTIKTGCSEFAEGFKEGFFN
ncbi:hypothetical protein, partial [Bacillus cereus]|uniref:hypothetical protein n=1 Tax=Bacillus cereus TaxID=1396 RepID=UPI00366ACD29